MPISLPNSIEVGQQKNPDKVQENDEALRDQANSEIATINAKFPVQTADIGDLQVTEPKIAAGSTGLAKGCFSAYRNAALSVANAAIITFDTEEWDVSSWYDTATGRFTPQVAGYFRLSAGVATDATFVAGNAWGTMLRKNGATVKYGTPTYPTFSSLAETLSTVTALVSANGTTDFFAIHAIYDPAGPIQVNAGASTAYFQGELVGRS